MEMTLGEKLKQWRKPHSVAVAAAYLDMSPRTLNGIEQGRAFSYEGLLRLVMENTKIEGGEHGA
ncbi:XRE family transcriptional regulator [Rhizobium sp. BK399]|uniref:XRE family transcriptional regulator n=1 Tax=Rhizobium sp. BK399 TaxID=2587063 RepID=UPI00161E227A|nr:XRE family transcriptional regulator [Rhizobium sp. BK399]MBB3540790.1 hypothetical protein [Rhizobium sp. BK399]